MRQSSRDRTASVALNSSCWRTLSGRSSRKPVFSASLSSLSAALSSAAKPFSENCAPELLATQGRPRDYPDREARRLQPFQFATVRKLPEGGHGSLFLRS